MGKDRLTIMVSSTVYGIEELLERIYTLLTGPGFGYEVWMSHKGTVPVFSTKSAFENCIHAVEACDLFLGLITPHYGSGVADADGDSITHRELLKAVELDKPRWILAHDHVVFARTLVEKLRDSQGNKLEGMTLEKSPVMDDLRVIDMYEEAIRSELPVAVRQGNWAQKYVTSNDAMLFATAQFFRYREVEQFVKENLKNGKNVAAEIQRRNGGRGDS